MTMYGAVLARCEHANSNGSPKGCNVCVGSGYVKVVPDRDGEPVPCVHGNTDGKGSGCGACGGSGWAGLIK